MRDDNLLLLAMTVGVIAVIVLVSTFTSELRHSRERKERQRRREERMAQRIPPGTTDLAGEPCAHTEWHRWRGFMMCSNPMCAEIRNLDGTTLTRAGRRALDETLKREQDDK